MIFTQPTKIDWADYVWNIVTGCENGCPYCYAKKMATRLRGRYGYPKTDPFKPTYHPDRARDPDNLKKPSKIFVCSMADLFGDWVQRDWIIMTLDTVAFNPQHTFIFLTKNPKRYSEFDFPKNAWIGYSTPGPLYHKWDPRNKDTIKFISIEPMMGPLIYTENLQDTDWTIIGGETGNRKGKVRLQAQWLYNALDILDEKGIPVFIKKSAGGVRQDYPEGK